LISVVFSDNQHRLKADKVIDSHWYVSKVLMWRMKWVTSQRSWKSWLRSSYLVQLECWPMPSFS